MKQKFLLKTMLLLCALIVGVSNVWATDVTYTVTSTSAVSKSGTAPDGATATYRSTYSSKCQLTGGNSMTLTLSGYAGKKITGITLSMKSNTSKGAGTLSVKAGETTIASISDSKFNTSSWNGAWSTSYVDVSVSMSNNSYAIQSNENVVITIAATENSLYCESFKLTYEDASSGGSTPSITANNVNIAYDATNGSIGYSLSNAEGNVSASITSGDWLSLGDITASAVPFTCSANISTSPRNATVTLSFTGATTKVVTVTQAGRPNVISDITANSTAYTVVGTVVATNSRGFVIGDGTGYVYTYLGSTPSQSVNDKVKISGTTGTYGQIIQFTNSATITAETTSTYDGTPAATVLDASGIASYDNSEVYKLSNYVQLEGTLGTTTSGNNTFYDISVVTGNTTETARISYPTTAQTTALSALVGKTVRVKGYFAGFSSSTFTMMLESVVEVTEPTLSVDPTTAQAFTYAVGNGPSDDQMFTVTGKNLASADITASVSSEYEITDDTDYSSSVTIASGDRVSVRLKAGLAKGEHNGTLTLSSTDATDVVINLSGTVTGQTYAIEQYTTPETAHGTITFSPASPIEDGTEVTLSAEPAEGYTFTADSWVIYKQSGEDYVVDNSITVTANKFNMPAYAIWVDGTFNAKPTYAITCVADPVAGGEIISDLGNAYNGQTVTLSYTENTGYKLSSIVITKTSDGSATGITPAVSGGDFTFTMPGYAVTATATYKEVYTSGTFAKYSSAITEGYYVITYGNYVLKNTISSNRFDYYYLTDKDNIKDNMFTDPDPSIVWYIKPNGNYWTLYNDEKGEYAAGTGSKNQGALIESVTDFAKWTVTMSNGTFQFENLGRSNALTGNSNRWLRNNAGSGWACYADATGGALTLYKMTVLTPRTITFEGNGGTYNEATTYTQDVYDGIDDKLDANKFTRDGYEFVAWNNQADGVGTSSYVDGAKITVTGGDLTLYAQWAPLYTLTIDDNIEGGSVAIEGNVPSAIEDAEIELSYTPNAGHKFSAWNVYKEGDTSTKVTVTDNKFAMPNYNVVISATFEEVPTYSLVTDVNDIVPGKHYIIASGTNGSVKAMGNQNTNYRNVVSVTASNGIIPETDGVFEFVIYGPNADGNYTIYDAKYNSNAGGYLYANSSSSNYMGTQDSNDANGKWSIEIANTGSATINAQGTNTRNCMRFNGDRFSCYASTTSVSALPYLYVKDGDTPVATTASVKLNASGYATFASATALDFLDADAGGIEYSAWQITGISGDAITFSQIKSTVAAGEGILLKGTPNATINLNVLPIGGETLGDNKLEGITTATAIVADTYYGLKGNTFVKVKAGTIPAGKALLPASEIPSGARELNFVFEGEQTTSISEECRVKSEEFATATIFDLQGRKVTKPQKGLYIVNGRKVVVK